MASNTGEREKNPRADKLLNVTEKIEWPVQLMQQLQLAAATGSKNEGKNLRSKKKVSDTDQNMPPKKDAKGPQPFYVYTKEQWQSIVNKFDRYSPADLRRYLEEDNRFRVIYNKRLIS